jgi:hypothetical protein
MAALLRAGRTLRRAALGIALWGTALAGCIALIFGPLQGIVATALFVAFGALMLKRYRGGTQAALQLAVGLAAAGLVIGSIPVDVVRDIADGLVACAIVIVLTVLFQYGVLDRLPVRDQTSADARVQVVRLRAVRSLRMLVLRFDDASWHRIWIGAAAAAVLLAAAVGLGAARSQSGWRLAGGTDGAAVWNAGFLEGALRRDGVTLRDAAIVTADGTAPRVGIADSPAVTAAKLAFPGPWRGPELANLLAIFDLTALLACAVLLVAELSGTVGGAAIGVAAVLLATPLLRQVGATAPFDLWPALAITTLALRRPSMKLAAAATGLGLLNVAGGYELAVLACGLGLTRRLGTRLAWALGIAGVAGSVVGALAAGVLAPDATTLSLWWSSNALVQLTRASGIVWPWIAAAFALAALVAAPFWSLAKRDRATREAAVAAIIAGVLAIPALLGGVPLLVPARALDVLPLGWPTARILAVAVVLLAVPVAAAVRLLGAPTTGARRPMRALALIALTVTAFAVGCPAGARMVLPPLPPGSAVVELPLAQSGSRASFVFADELLERGARILQPMPYVSARTLLSADDDADRVIAALRKQPGPAFVVLRVDVYAEPELRFAQPTVIDAADYAVPMLGREPGARLSSLTDEARVYQLLP